VKEIAKSFCCHQLFQGRVNVFDESQIAVPIFFEKEYKDGSWWMIDDQLPQRVHHAFSDALGEAASLVSCVCHMVTLST
jgi:hypothetical protein